MLLCAPISLLLGPSAGGLVPSVVCHSRDGTYRERSQPRRWPPWRHHPVTLGKDTCPGGGFLYPPSLARAVCQVESNLQCGWAQPAVQCPSWEKPILSTQQLGCPCVIKQTPRFSCLSPQKAKLVMQKQRGLFMRRATWENSGLLSKRPSLSSLSSLQVL